MPNGEFAAVVPPIVPLDVLQGPDVPGTPIPSGPIGGVISAVVDFFSGIFGGGGTTFLEEQHKFAVATPAPVRAASIQAFVEGQDADPVFSALLAIGEINEAAVLKKRAEQGRDPITGRLPIPLPEFGGPELVTERFRNLPPIPDVPEVVQGPVGFEGVDIMPVDVPLLSGIGTPFLPAVRSVAQPTLQGVVGGLAGGFLSEFLRPIQETGLGTVPMRQAVPQVGGCPAEKPHTRILRAIKMQTGVSINLSRAKSLIRELGLENAARCLGISAGEVCSLLIVASPRRRRGISASDIRIVKRTARRFENLKHALGHLGGRSHHPHRRRHTSRHK